MSHLKICIADPPAIQYFKIVVFGRVVTLWSWVGEDSSSTYKSEREIGLLSDAWNNTFFVRLVRIELVVGRKHP